MEHYDVKRFGLLLAIQAEIEGMKAHNMRRQAVGAVGVPNLYKDEDLSAKADDLRNIVYFPEDKL